MSNHTFHCLDVFIRQALSSSRLPELYMNSLDEICRTLQCLNGVMLHGICDEDSLKECASFPPEHQYSMRDCQKIFDSFAPHSGIPNPGMMSIKAFNNLTSESLPESICNPEVDNAFSIIIRPSTNEYFFIAIFSAQQNLINEISTEFLTHAAQVLLTVINQKNKTSAKETSLRSALQAKHEWVATVDAISDIICTVDLNFNILRANKAIELWGVGKVDNISGKSIHGLLHSNCTLDSCDLITGIKEIKKSLQKNNDGSTQLFDPCLNKDLKISANKILIPGSSIDSQVTDSSFAVVIIKDITEQVSATNMMLEYNERLADNVKERTDQLTKANKQLNDLTRQILNAQEIERRRISLELHDGVGQNLTAIKYFIEELIGSCKDSTNDHHIKKLEKIVEKVKGTVDEIRNISMDLRPSILDDLGIGATISWFFREFSNMHSNVSIETDIDINEEKITSHLATTIYRITQEATNNIIKHANATQIKYRLIIKDQSLFLIITDNGTGFNLNGSHGGTDNRKKGLGLVSMKERAMLTGGQIEYESSGSGSLIIRGEWKID